MGPGSGQLGDLCKSITHMRVHLWSVQDTASGTPTDYLCQVEIVAAALYRTTKIVHWPQGPARPYSSRAPRTLCARPVFDQTLTNSNPTASSTFSNPACVTSLPPIPSIGESDMAAAIVMSSTLGETTRSNLAAADSYCDESLVMMKWQIVCTIIDSSLYLYPSRSSTQVSASHLA
jgi:hypothetical protein